MSDGGFEKFRDCWLVEIAKIEKRAIDSEGTYNIFLNFHKDRLFLEIDATEQEFDSAFLELEILESKLRVALETARSRFKLENRSILARIAEGILGTTLYSLKGRRRDKPKAE